MLIAQAPSKQTMVGIAEARISTDITEVIVAPNLGSCLGILAYDPQAKVGGIAHCLLPSSASDPDKAAQKPCMYVDSGVAFLLESLFSQGAQKKHLMIVCVGGAAMSDPNGVFEIGKKNFTVLRKLLWKNNLLLAAEDVGGDLPRTLSLELKDGSAWLKTQRATKRLL